MVASLPDTQGFWVRLPAWALFLIEDRVQSRELQVKTQINKPTFYLRFELKTRIYEENPIETTLLIHKKLHFFAPIP